MSGDPHAASDRVAADRVAADRVAADRVDVLVVGGGPAGLAAAVALRRARVQRVLVVERDAEAGGVPRHSDHPGFGLRDLGRAYRGPRYAAAYRRLAAAHGVQVAAGTTATGWAGPLTLELTGPDGLRQVAVRAVLLATGCRERPRAARLVPGTRPLGVLTTGALQQLVFLHGQRVGRRAVVVGAEHVSYSALLTLAHAGCQVAAMVTELPAHQTLAAFHLAARLRWHVPLHTASRVTAILGRQRVEAVEVGGLDGGARQRIPCDTVVFTGDWIPDHELARSGGLAIDPGTRGPLVDPRLRTSTAGVFAAGNLLHAAETADVAALEGRHVAAVVAAALRGGAPWPARTVPVACRPPLRWVAPSAIAPDSDPASPPLNRFALRSDAFLRLPEIEVRQDGRRLWCGRLPRVVPGRTTRLPHAWTAAVDPDGGEVRIAVVRSRYGARP
jgi:NADPH-dependent 2,4-dienoyl-CoA reductase/sulfur reductase-like enzyme